MARFLVTHHRQGKEPDKHGNFVCWLTLEDEQGTETKDVYYAYKDIKNTPEVGKFLEGVSITHTDKGPWLRREQQPRSDGKKGWVPRIEDDPAVYAGKQASIAMQHSQSVAAAVIAAAEDRPKTLVALHEKAREMAADYAKQVSEAAREAVQRTEAMFRIELEQTDEAFTVEVVDDDGTLYKARNIIGLDVALTIAGDAISREIYPPPEDGDGAAE